MMDNDWGTLISGVAIFEVAEWIDLLLSARYHSYNISLL